MNILDTLKERGYIEQVTDEEKLKELFEKRNVFLFI